MIPKIQLKRQHLLPIQNGNPWIFAQAIETIKGNVSPGDEVELTDPWGNFIGKGFFSPKSSIPVRILSRNPDEVLDEKWFESVILKASQLREEHNIPNDQTTGYRLINGEGDGLPGLVIDIYDDKGVIYFGTIGMKKREKIILDNLSKLLGLKSVFEIAFPGEQEREGIKITPGLIRGTTLPPWEFKELGLYYSINLPQGQKTGYYLDQRENRNFIRKFCKDKRVLDLFTYTGGFSLNSAISGAFETTGVDSSAVSLLQAEAQSQRNGIKSKIKFLRSDVKAYLNDLIYKKETFDLIIMDPPKFMTSQSSRESALKGYKYINSLALSCVAPGGYLATCSCSGRLSQEEFLNAIGEASVSAKRNAKVVTIRSAGIDHPSLPGFKQGRYLKFVMLKVD